MKLFDALLDLLYPPRCVFCHRLLSNTKRPVCERCLKNLPYTGAADKRTDLGPLDACFSPLVYTGTVKESLHRYKFGQLTGYAGVYADFMLKCIDENRFSCDSITWVPVSRKRLRRRGYDQARLLAEALALRMQLPCGPALVKIRHNKQQSLTRSAAERKANVKGAYRCLPEAEVSGKRILLVDDIVTTGSTLKECAGVLRSAGAASVAAITVARAAKNERS